MTIPIHILSTGRTGTVFFSRLFGNLYPEVDAYHERGISRPVQILTNLYFDGLIPRQGPILAWKIFKGREVARCKKPYHLDANSFLYGISSVAPDLIPGLKVVHIVRDPRTYVTSHLNYARYKKSSFIANYLVPFWQPSPLLSGKIPMKKCLSLSRLEKYAWIWDFKNKVIESIENTEIPYLRIRFEDIFNTINPEENFSRMTDFIGLPRQSNVREFFNRPENQAPKDHIHEWTEWEPTQCLQLQEICGNLMTKYGYGDETAWQQKTGISK